MNAFARTSGPARNPAFDAPAPDLGPGTVSNVAMAAAQGAPPPAPAPLTRRDPDGSMVMTLQKPIPVHNPPGAMARELRLRPPVFSDWSDLGDPWELPPNTEIRVITLEMLQPKREVVGRWLARLSGHDPGVIGQLSMADWRIAFYLLASLVLGSTA